MKKFNQVCECVKGNRKMRAGVRAIKKAKKMAKKEAKYLDKAERMSNMALERYINAGIVVEVEN